MPLGLVQGFGGQSQGSHTVGTLRSLPVVGKPSPHGCWRNRVGISRWTQVRSAHMGIQEVSFCRPLRWG
jgi:hypothetical protein